MTRILVIARRTRARARAVGMSGNERTRDESTFLAGARDERDERDERDASSDEFARN
jgi:hypothetical protein